MALDATMPNFNGMVIGAAAARPDTVTGLRDEFRSSFANMLKAAPEHVRKELRITSGFRSPEVQAKLWKDALKKYGSAKEARKWVAPPGKSKHGEGVAADLHYASDKTKEWISQNASNYGLAFPLKHEPWHMELATARKKELSPPPAAMQGEAGTDQMTGASGADYLTAGQKRKLYEKYNAGELDSDQAREYAEDVLAGVIDAPGPLTMPESLWKAYRDGDLPEEAARELETDVQAGKWKTPLEDRGFFESLADLVTGSDREVAATEAIPDWTNMPMPLGEARSWKTAVGAIFAAPDEAAKIIKAQFPKTEIRKDAAGTIIVKSPIDGKEYAIKPGMRAGDLLRIIPGMALFAPAAAGGPAVGPGIAMGIEAGVQGIQEATGGDFDVADVALAGAGEAGGRLLSAGTKAIGRGIGSGVSRAMGRGGKAAEATARPVAPPPPPPATPAEIGELARQAARGGKGSRDAVAALAGKAKPNAEAIEAAERLGINVPADVLVDDPMVRKAAGLTRSIAGSEADVDFDQAIKRAIDQADAAFEKIGASPDIAAVSDRVRQSLQRSEKAIRTEAGKLFEEARQGIDQAAMVETPALGQHVEEVARIMGGVDDLDPTLRRLYDRITAGDVTYGWLDNLRRDIGRGYQRAGPFADTASRDLDQLYGALARDQAAAVQLLGGDEALEAFQRANKATGLYKDFQEKIVSAFGKDMEGSIAKRLRSAVWNARDGDAAALSRILKIIPPGLRKEAIATAIAAASRGTKGGETGFGFAQFAKFYSGLAQNKPVFNQVMSTLGPDAARFMADLADLAGRITDARGNVLTTGKANQAMMQAMLAEGIVEKALGSAILRRGAQAAGGGAGAVAGGGFGAAAGAGLAGVIADIAQGMASKDRLAAAGKMFASEQFKDFVEEAATNPRVSDRATRRLARSAAYKRFAKELGDPEAITRPERFIINWVQAARQQASQEE